MISMTYPDGLKHSYEYDDQNNKISETRPNGDKYSV
jgi:YD repeat-containing protein